MTTKENETEMESSQDTRNPENLLLQDTAHHQSRVNNDACHHENTQDNHHKLCDADDKNSDENNDVINDVNKDVATSRLLPGLGGLEGLDEGACLNQQYIDEILGPVSYTR